MSRLSKWVVSSLGTLALGSVLLTGSSAEAFSCSVTGTSGGNPGGEPVSTCTGLVEGDTFTVTVDQTVNTDVLLATAQITVVDIGSGTALIQIDLANNSSGGGQTNRIVSFGLAIEPDATGGDLIQISGTAALDSFDEGNFPGFTLVEFCATSGPNCAGGGNGGLQSGQTQSFQFSLTDGFTAGGTIDLSEFAIKFQGGVASYEKPGTPVGGSPVGGSPVAGAPVAGQPVAGTPVAGQVPQPGSLMLVGAALLSALVASAGLRRLRSSRS